jgi:hypothetical protein
MEFILSTFTLFSVNSAEESFYGALAHGLGNFSCCCSEDLKLFKTLD